MASAADNGASEQGFFDQFNQDPQKQATTEEVNRRLCEVLVELAEDVTMAEAEAKAATAPSQGGHASGEQGETREGTGPVVGNGRGNGAAATAAAAGEEAADGAGGPVESGGLDEVAALQAYNDALAAIMEETGMASKDICSLPDEHPLKELFFAAFDQAMFRDLLARFVEQVQRRKGGPGEWDAEAAVGECDEDHTLE